MLFNRLLLLSGLGWTAVQAMQAIFDEEQYIKERAAPKRIAFQDVIGGTFRPQSASLQWTSSGQDGSYIDTNSTTGDLWLANVLDTNRQLLVNSTLLNGLLKTRNSGADVAVRDLTIQPSGTRILVEANWTKLYRYSGFADYYIYDAKTGTVEPVDPNQTGDIRYAGWSPTGDSIAFVRGNDLYINRNGTNTRITNDGGPDIFNAIPDWVYEEEIFGTTNTLWYSPDGRFLAYLRFNETGVPTYRIPYYLNGKTAPPYPRELELRYPKVGQTNPTVTLHLLEIDNLSKGPQRLEFDAFPANDLVIGEVAWITDSHSHLSWRAFNRVQDQDKFIVREISSGKTTVAAERSEKQGWLDNLQSVQYVPRLNSYVYLSDQDGWTHIYLQSVNGNESIQVTKGEWEVTSILYVGPDTVFYQSTEQDSTERHIYSIDLKFLNRTPLVNSTAPGYYTASFSSGGGYYILSNTGPNLPRHELYAVTDRSTPVRVLQDNSRLRGRLAEFNLPNSTWLTINHPSGYSLNALETLPPDFNPAKKYPLLLNPYGGPGSQQTAKTFRGVDWWTYTASDPALEYVILTVDNRGTGYKGKAFRHLVTRQLGKLEAEDQIYAASEWAKKEYIDASKIVIQGWSYGGYLSSKVIEVGSDVISSAIITAPVSDWRFYDSMYTERYMKTPQDNPDGYYETSVHNATGFVNARGGVLLQHGTGDDNVHTQNSFVLTDTLMTGGLAARPNATNSLVKRDTFDFGARSFEASNAPQFEENLLTGKPGPQNLYKRSISKASASESESLRARQESSPDAQAAPIPVPPNKLTVQWFTDSDHGISFHGSTLFLRKQMARWLYREKRRVEKGLGASEEDSWFDSL